MAFPLYLKKEKHHEYHGAFMCNIEPNRGESPPEPVAPYHLLLQ